MVNQQEITDAYALYQSDCMYVMPTLPDKSVDLIHYSPPFMGLYHYSSDENDLSNCDNIEGFMQQYEFVVAETARLIKPGCIVAVHCQDVVTDTTKHNLFDFPHEIIKIHKKYGFWFKNRITIWKEPLEVRMRTMVKSLMHKTLCEDSSNVYPSVPDQLLIFKMGGEREVPVTHEFGLSHYAGAIPLLPDMETKYGDWNHILIKYKNWKDPKTNKLSHIIFQRYMSSVWDDIRSSNVLPFKDSREEDDEKHVHPLQLDVIDRVVELYSNPGEVVLTPFMGVGSEVFSPVSMGRKAIGIELKDTYFKQAVLNCKDAERRFLESRPAELFDAS